MIASLQMISGRFDVSQMSAVTDPVLMKAHFPQQDQQPSLPSQDCLKGTSVEARCVETTFMSLLLSQKIHYK